MVQDIESMQDENRKFPPPENFRAKAHIRNFEEYKTRWKYSIQNPEGFWAEMASEFFWYKKWDKVREYDFRENISIKWFEGSQTNITVNCLDRHVQNGLGDRVAIIWEGNEPNETRRITYRTLLMQVCSFANVLKNLGVKKGDRITIYMPMVPEAAVAMLACARIGAVHSVIFGGFSAESIADRLIDADSNLIITADFGLRGAKKIPLKESVDEAIRLCKGEGHNIHNCIVYQRTGDKINWVEGRDHWWHELNAAETTECAPEKMEAEDPLFILYTSGSTGKPKGVLHTTAGYMVFAATTFKYIFDYRPEDIFWCTADVGWVTGHSYVVYGPLANAATTFMFEGIPTYPDAGRFWDVCERHKVNIFYTAPTAIRALMREGEEWVKKYNLSSLRVLGTVGEPINPEAWMWYYNFVGQERCPIVDTWWQTETGGILISPLPGCTDLKPGSATIPFFGVNP
ncbi:MAG: acetate--CoA ligase, partial [Deltaproteobacteria bacterium]|nr:acetate--CoA ligase [Deltaproteobacteria bacterium]